MDDPVIEDIPGSDPGLHAALAEAGLPTDDLTRPGRAFFRFSDQGRVLGFIGWETAGDTAALLRSLVVLPPGRGRGAGTAMAHWALTRLGEEGFTDAYLLTTTAQSLARRLGFGPMDRAQAPAAIRQSRQYASLCPASAALFHRSLP